MTDTPRPVSAEEARELARDVEHTVPGDICWQITSALRSLAAQVEALTKGEATMGMEILLPEPDGYRTLVGEIYATRKLLYEDNVELRAERDALRAQLENTLDSHREGAWMARALDAEREGAALRARLAEAGDMTKSAREMAAQWKDAAERKSAACVAMAGQISEVKATARAWRRSGCKTDQHFGNAILMVLPEIPAAQPPAEPAKAVRVKLPAPLNEPPLSMEHRARMYGHNNAIALCADALKAAGVGVEP